MGWGPLKSGSCLGLSLGWGVSESAGRDKAMTVLMAELEAGSGGGLGGVGFRSAGVGWAEAAAAVGMGPPWGPSEAHLSGA